MADAARQAVFLPFAWPPAFALLLAGRRLSAFPQLTTCCWPAAGMCCCPQAHKTLQLQRTPYPKPTPEPKCPCTPRHLAVTPPVGAGLQSLEAQVGCMWSEACVSYRVMSHHFISCHTCYPHTTYAYNCKLQQLLHVTVLSAANACPCRVIQSGFLPSRGLWHAKGGHGG